MSSIKLPLERSFTNLLKKSKTTWTASCNINNNERTNQGKHCQGRTPMKTFQDGRLLYQQYFFESSEEEKNTV
jgi:hypothetical protein